MRAAPRRNLGSDDNPVRPGDVEMKALMPIILATTIPILWFAMRISDTELALPVIVGISILGLTYCWLARRPETPRSRRR
jgi:hypothetical protein